MSLLTGSPSTMSPLGLRITMTTWAWKVIISTGPWSIILPIANYNTGRNNGQTNQMRSKTHLTRVIVLSAAINNVCFCACKWRECLLKREKLKREEEKIITDITLDIWEQSMMQCVWKHLHLCYQCPGFWTGRAAPALWPAGSGEPADCTSEGKGHESTSGMKIEASTIPVCLPKVDPPT